MSFHFDYETKKLFSYKNLVTYSLNDLGALILSKHIIGGISIDSVVSEIAKEYGVDYEKVYCDSLEIINQLLGIDGLSAWADGFINKGSVCHSWQLRTPIVHIIENCNSPCIMCDCWKAKKNHHNREILKSLFTVLKSKGAESIMVSGGEPLLHPQLIDILNDIKELSMDVMLNTNAITLHKNSWLQDMNLEQLVVSMDGITDREYKYYRGSNKFSQVWNNIKDFKEKSPSTQVGIRVTLNASNFNKIPELIDLAQSNKVDAIGFSPADISSNSFARYCHNDVREAELMNAMIPSAESLECYLQEFYQGSNDYDVIRTYNKSGYLSWSVGDFINCYKFYLSIRRDNYNIFDNQLCNFPKISMVVDYNGDLKNCFYSQPFGNINSMDSIDWIFSVLDELVDSGACMSCRGKVFCG